MRRAVKKIAHDYNVNWSMDKEVDEPKTVDAIKAHMPEESTGGRKKEAKKSPKDEEGSDAAMRDETDQDRTTPHAKQA